MLLVLVAGCVPTGATDESHEINELYWIVFTLAAIVFVFVGGAIAIFPFLFRRRDNRLPKQIHGSNKLEVLWTAIPLVIVSVLFVFSERALSIVDRDDAGEEAAFTIDVFGFQWQWDFNYGDFTVRGTVADPPEIVLPVDTQVHFRLHTDDVIHAFYVPDFLFKRDVVPGRTNEFSLTSDRLGTYQGQCAEFCGLLHARMTFTVRTVTAGAYEEWVADQRALEEERRLRLEACRENPSSELAVIAEGVQFVTDEGEPLACLATEAQTDFTIAFDNRDAGVDHNVSIYDDAVAHFQGEIFTGPGTREYAVPAIPEPGDTYEFVCDVHPTSMRGTFVVVENA